MYQLLLIAIASIALTVTIFATGTKVSWKLIPSFYVKPLATSLPLYLSRVPSALHLILYTHLHPMRILPGGNGVIVQFGWKFVMSCGSPGLRFLRLLLGLIVVGDFVLVLGINDGSVLEEGDELELVLDGESILGVGGKFCEYVCELVLEDGDNLI
ncbi:hypothetical protein Tco_0304340 [Tanacetum coccineum]